MSASNGVIRIGRKGIKKFAFGEDGPVFEVDVVTAFQQWIAIDESFRGESGKESVKTQDMPQYHHAATEYAKQLSGSADGMPQYPNLTTAEALDFIARLREQYDELADFFRPKSRERPDSLGTSEAELRFSVEPDPSPTSTS
jgi:hypothetical protein